MKIIVSTLVLFVLLPEVVAFAWQRGSRRSSGGSRSYQGGSSSANRKSQPSKSVTSRKTTGVYTKAGAPVRNVNAYKQAGGKCYNRSGKALRAPEKYSSTVQNNSMQAAAKYAQKKFPEAKAFSYTAELPNGRTYVGMTTNPSSRIKAHVEGRGAKVTQELPPIRVTLHPHYSVEAAKAAETKKYYEQKRQLGKDRVRGAGHTKRFSLSESKKDDE
jgi:predicted GIY-YIG superfamily endonuclease